MDTNRVELDMLFETSWEVCNKIGGIYTVLSTKAKTLHKLYGDKLVFVGPDVWDDVNRCPVFRESKSLLKEWTKGLELPYGIQVRVGRWEVPGRPIAVLVRFEGIYAVKNEIYGQMWERFGVDSLHAYGDYDEGCAFAVASALVMDSIRKTYCPSENSRVIAHFNEWTTAMGLLYLKLHAPAVATVFTTHATCIGRSICGNGKPLYDYLKGYNGDQMSRELNMEAKHSLEKAAAHQADCFTAVSEVTARECEQLLEIRPQVVTPNGFEGDFVPSRTKFAAKREAARQRLLEVASALTGKHYAPDTFILGTSGRMEYRNKGLDIFLDSMKALGNAQLSRKVLAMIMVPAWTREPRPDLATRLTQKTRTPLANPWYTHEVYNPDQDVIMTNMRRLDITNAGRTKVDVIYVPSYLIGTDGIYNLDYYDMLIGLDATVFASYYEPWGYTPLESIAFGVPTVTTSLSGFGQWVLSDHADTLETTGVKVVLRNDSNYGSVVEQIAQTVASLDNCTPQALAAIDKAAKATAATAAWTYFVRYYIDAFTVALRRCDMRGHRNDISEDRF